MKRCLLLLVALATMTSAYALVPGEFPIAPLPKGPAPFDRRNVIVAVNSTVALAVWEDFRVDPSRPPRVWGSRFRRDTGQVLDPTGISIAPLAATEGSNLRAVATDGADFLVAWTEGYRLRLSRVLANGEVVEVAAPDLDADDVSITFAGDMYAVFFTLPKGNNRFLPGVHVALFDKSGRLVRVVGNAVYSNGAPAITSVASAGDTFLYLAWSDVADGAVHTAAFLTSQLRAGVLVPAPKVVEVSSASTAPSLISIATDGTNVLATWLDVDSNPPVYQLRRFDGNGTPLGPITLIERAGTIPAAPAAAWDGIQYVVAFSAADNSLEAVRYTANGARSDSTPLPISPPNVAGVAAAASPGRIETVIAWLSKQSNGATIAADFILPDGAVRFTPGHLSLSTSFAYRSDAVIAWRGNHYLATWSDAVLGDIGAAFGRLSPEGQPLDGSGIDLGASASALPPSLATNGSTAVVAWLDVGGVAAWFVDANGNPARRLSNFPGGVPSVNWNGQQYVVVWRSSVGQLVGVRMSPAGSILDQQLISITDVTGQPFIGWTGNSYVAVYQQLDPCFPSPCDPPSTLWAQLLTPSLTPIGTRIQISEHKAGLPTLADGPGGTLVVWPRTVGSSTTLRGARILNGAVLDPLNGFEIGVATQASVYASSAGWGVVSGPYLWNVSRNGGVSPRQFEFPFVPVGAHSAVVLGGPAPLVVYRRDPVGAEQMMQVVARYFTGPARHRGVRH